MKETSLYPKRSFSLTIVRPFVILFVTITSLFSSLQYSSANTTHAVQVNRLTQTSALQQTDPGTTTSEITATLTLTTAKDLPVPGSVPLVNLPEGTINIALLGIDKRPAKTFLNTDVIMIASINPDVPAVTLLSIPRDTLVYIPGQQVWKVNTAYGSGGIDLFKDTIRYNFGIKIDYYAMINFEGLVHAVESLGGVDVVATCPIYHIFPKDPYYMGGPYLAEDYKDTFTGEIWKAGTKVPTTIIDLPKPGIYTLNGMQALAYVRARKGIPGGDVDRGRREQRVVRALFAKAKQLGTVTKIPELLAQFDKDVTTDLSLTSLLQLAGIANRFSDAVIQSRFLDQGGANGEALRDAGEGNRVWQNRRDYIQQALTVALNQRVAERPTVEVLNGTSDAGFAAAAADRLNELGFRVTEIKPADKAYAQSALIDHNTIRKGNGSAIPLMLNTFNIRSDNVVADPQPGAVKYTVIVGADFNTCYFANSLRESGSEPISVSEDPLDAFNPQAPKKGTDITVPLNPTPAAAATPAPVEVPAQNPAVMPAPANEPTTVIVPPGDYVNVRSGPGTNFAVLGALTGNDIATIVSRTEDGKWIEVNVGNRRGWVSARVVRLTGPMKNVPPISAADASAGTNLASITVPTGDIVNVRRGPSTSNRIAWKLSPRQNASIIGKSSNGQWWQISRAGRTGWVYAQIVVADGDTATVPVVR